MQRLPEPQRGRFALAILPRTALKHLLQHAARLALAGPLRVLDGGNRFNAYTVSLTLRRHTAEVQAALERIRVARAFTCYQVEALLESSLADETPTLVLDLLATFRDENVPLPERLRLLGICIGHLQRLAQRAPLLVSATPQGAADTDELLATLEEAAGVVWRFGPTPPALPPRLF